MNTSHNNSSTIPWGKIILVVAIVAIVAVFSGRAGLENLFDLEPGTLGGPAVAKKAEDDRSEDPSNSSTSQSNSNDSRSPQSSRRVDSSDTSERQTSTQKPFQLQRKGFVMESPEGLTYYVGDRGENRIDHVMRHAKDIPNRPGSHGVFHGDKDQILRTIDEAYSLIKANSSQVVNKENDQDRPTTVAYEINMKRKIGFRGGQQGKRTGNPELTILKLVLDQGNRVITAYPFR